MLLRWARRYHASAFQAWRAADAEHTVAQLLGPYGEMLAASLHARHTGDVILAEVRCTSAIDHGEPYPHPLIENREPQYEPAAGSNTHPNSIISLFHFFFFFFFTAHLRLGHRRRGTGRSS